jgi:hypothetical protein
MKANYEVRNVCASGQAALRFPKPAPHPFAGCTLSIAVTETVLRTPA